MSTTQQQPEKPRAAEPGKVTAIPAECILARSQDSRPEIQGYVVLARSLEWQLGQSYLEKNGVSLHAAARHPETMKMAIARL